MNEHRQISEREKAQIAKRDHYACRYCGDKNGPFEFDHVYPYVKGGETSIRNVVLSCSKCNRRKHDSVGIWPMPVGYFDEMELYDNFPSEENPLLAGWNLYYLLGLIVIFWFVSFFGVNELDSEFMKGQAVFFGVIAAYIGIRKYREISEYKKWMKTKMDKRKQP